MRKKYFDSAYLGKKKCENHFDGFPFSKIGKLGDNTNYHYKCEKCGVWVRKIYIKS